MIVIYVNGEGTAEKLSPEHVYQGSNQSGVLVFAPTPPQTAMGIAFKLPDGTSTPYYPMTYQGNYEGLSQYEYTIPTSITQLSGQAAIAVQALYSDGQQNSQQVDFEIEPSVVVVPPEPMPDVYDLLKQAIAKNAADIAGIQGQIDNIEDLAERAEEASSNAVATANEAKATADGLAESIAQANETAQQAVSTANGAVEDIAKYKSDTDADIAQFKQSVNEEIADITATANGAVDTANEAKATADGLAESIAQANETASEAKEIAEEALEQSKVTGTKVNIDGAFQSDLNFDSNPQEQLNDLKSADTALQNSKVNKSGDILSGRLLIDQRNGGIPYFTVQVADNKWLSLQIAPDGKSRGLRDGETNAWFIYLDENGRAHYADNEFGQRLRGRKSVAISNNLVNEVSGFYEDPFEQYSKYIVCGDGGDKFLLGWQYGDKRIHAKVYNSRNLQHDGIIPYIETSKLEPTTANGWTVGDKKLAIPGDGVYLLSIATSGDSDIGVYGGMPFIMILRGVDALGIKNYIGVGITTNTSLAIGSPTLVTYMGLEKDGVISGSWSAKRLNASSPSSIDIGSVAYKKLA